MTSVFDPEFLKAIEPMLPAMQNAPKLEVHDVPGRRTRLLAGFGPLLDAMPDPEGVERTEHLVKSHDGANISVFQYTPSAVAKSPTPTSAVVYYHGGGMILGEIQLFHKPTAMQALIANIPIFSVDYRVAPEHPHPTPVEDSYAGFTWLSENASKFNVDPKRIIIMGQSAGGGLAAAVAIMARDRGFTPPPAKQLLVYPMLDDRNTVVNPAIDPYTAWKNNDNITGWSALLGKDVVGTKMVSPYAAPARVKSVAGLPPLYLDVGDLDIFRNEDVAYAARFLAENISAELHVYPGVPHVFDAFAPQSRITQNAMQNRLRFLASI